MTCVVTKFLWVIVEHLVIFLSDGGVYIYSYGATEIQVPQPQGRRKTESNCDNSPCQVMMLEGYVLQFLSVQKVLKDTSAQYAEKKVLHDL